jgi:hypothetical protein
MEHDPVICDVYVIRMTHTGRTPNAFGQSGVGDLGSTVALDETVMEQQE